MPRNQEHRRRMRGPTGGTDGEKILHFLVTNTDLRLAQSFFWVKLRTWGVNRNFPWYLMAYLTTGFVDPTVGSRAETDFAPETCMRAVNRQPWFPRDRLVETACAPKFHVGTPAQSRRRFFAEKRPLRAPNHENRDFRGFHVFANIPAQITNFPCH